MRLQRYFIVFLLFVMSTMGITMWWKNKEFNKTLTELHNKIAMQEETVEIHKNAYLKKSVELESLESLLRTAEAENSLDKETIKKLRNLISKKDEEILAVNRIAVKWKKAYEGVINATQTEVPSDEPTGVTRTRIDFDGNFGYIKVKGYTVTNPAFSWLSIDQVRPLMLTLVLTQSKDGSWNVYVTSSEEQIALDVKLAGINPNIMKRKWYENISVDFGTDIKSDSLYPYVGVTLPIGPVSLSSGLWAGLVNGKSDLGWYTTVNYSWYPFER